MHKGTTRLTPTPPFDFDLTAGYYASFRGQYGDDLLDAGLYRRLMRVNGKLLLVSVRSVGDTEVPQLEVETEGDEVTESDVRVVSETVAWTLAVDAKIEEFYSHVKDDPVLGRVVPELHGFHPTRTDSVFEALVMAITAQQVSFSVARHIRQLIVETHGDRLSVDGRGYYTFPTPAALSSAGVGGLRAMKLSNRKAEYIVDVASGIISGSLSLESLHGLSDEEVEERLTSLRGIGTWTSQWLQIRALGRPDAFPSGDLALRRMVSRAYFEGQPVSESEVQEFSHRWSPWRSFATIYLMAAAQRGLLPA